MKKFLTWSIVLILLILFLFFVFKKIRERIETQKDYAERGADATAAPVEIFKTFKSSIQKKLTLVGDIKPGLEVEVFSKVPGKLRKKLVQIGDKVKKDEILALLERDEIGLTFEQAQVLSPISGQVNRIYFDLGSQIETNFPMMHIVNLDTVKIITHIAEEDIGFIKEGMTAEVKVEAYPQKSFSGRLTRLSPTLNPATHKIEIEMKIFNPQNLLKPGMFAQINILLAQHTNIIKIPHTTIILNNGKPYVFVVENGLAQKKEISLGMKDEEFAEVLSGLNEGEEVITLGNQEIKENDSVKVVGEEEIR